MNKSKNKYLKKNKGITLIALVVTIIILLILANVSINLVLGDNGIIQKAKYAKVAQTEAEVKEKVEMILAEYVAERESNNKELLTFLQENKQIDSVTDNEDGTYTIEIDGYAVVINVQKLGVESTDKNGKTTKINLSATTAKINETITATVKFGEQIDYTKCKWMYSTDLQLGTNEASYANTFTDAENTIQLSGTEQEIYYLHVLVVDKDGNKTEKISEGVNVGNYVTKIILDKTELSLDEGEEVTIVATVEPSDATIKELEWISSDETVAQVDETGKVKAIKEGNATITAISKDGSEIKVTCTVEVKKVMPTTNTTHTAKSLSYSWEILSKLAKVISDNDEIINNNTAEITIKMNGTNYTLGVGDTTTVTYDGKTGTVRILGFNHDKLTSRSAYGGDNTYAGISFEVTNIAFVKSTMDSTVWLNSKVRTNLNNVMINNLSNKTFIKQVNKSYISTYNDSKSVKTSADKLWLLSCSEIWDNAYSSKFTYGQAIAKEGEQYKFYKNIDATSSAYNTKLEKKQDGVGLYWWLRSPCAETGTKICRVTSSGKCDFDYRDYSNYVIPAFCI